MLRANLFHVRSNYLNMFYKLVSFRIASEELILLPVCITSLISQKAVNMILAGDSASQNFLKPVVWMDKPSSCPDKNVVQLGMPRV
jgi:hypothetical protein